MDERPDDEKFKTNEAPCHEVIAFEVDDRLYLHSPTGFVDAEPNKGIVVRPYGDVSDAAEKRKHTLHRLRLPSTAHWT